jgi:outer membrane protein
MKEHLKKLTVKLLALALLCASPSTFLRAQQQGERATKPASVFTGSIFGDTNAPKPQEPGAKETKDAEPSASPASYVTVALKLPAREEGNGAQTGQQQSAPPAPSANNPPRPDAPQQSPQTASPTQQQTQQSTNPAAPAGQPSQQPSLPPTAPANPAPTPSPADTQLDVPRVAEDFRGGAGPFPVLDRVGVEMSDQRSLSLREAIAMALENNKDIEVARQNVRAAEFDLQGARGVYDPRFLTNSYYERTETPAASFLSGTSSAAVTQTGFFSTSSFQGLSPKFGGGYRVDFVTNRIRTDNLFAALNPQYPTALTFNYTQPVLKGRAFDQNRRQIEIANKNLSLTDAQFRQRAIETITQVQRAYWDLVFALRNLQIQRDAVRDARTQLEHNRRLVAEGILAPIDVVAAEAQVSGFEQSVYSALDEVGRAENFLKNLIAQNRDAEIWNAALVPTDPVDLETPAIALPAAMDSALKTRPELQASDVARTINEIEQRFAREQTKPQVDLVASYGMVGLAGTANTAGGTLPFPRQPPPDILVGGYGQSIANLAANRFTNFRVGVTINLPLKNRTAEAQLGRSLVDGERIRVQREQLEQLIQVDVRNALQSVRTAEARLRAAAATRSASEQQYASEKRKFDAGQSTLFLVLERQTALTNARGNELRAQTELNKAIAELQRATGNALEANRVEVRVR